MKEIAKEEKILNGGGIVPIAVAAGYVFGVAIGAGSVVAVVEGLKWWNSK
jgi:hypothetical protein